MNRFCFLLSILPQLLCFSCSFFQSAPEDSQIHVSGNIEITEVRLAFKISGKLVDLALEEGDFVRQGDLIARLDKDQLEKQRDQALAVLKASESRKGEILALLEFQKSSVESQISQREAEVRRTNAALMKARTGARDQEIEEAQARLESARVAFDKAERDWNRAQNLISTEDISRSQYDQFKAAFEGSRANVIQAEQQLDLLREGSRSEDIEMAEAAVGSAEAGVEMARSGLLEIKKTEKSLATIEADIERAQAALELIETQIKDTELYTPTSGVVLTKAAENGEVLLAGSTVAVIGDLTRPWVRGYIRQQDLGRIKIGNRVKVKTDSFPEKTYIGRVSFIASKAEFTPKQIQTEEERVKLVYRIKIELENENQELKLNMPVDAEILTNELANQVSNP
jgi:HlyD family secretion protein